MERERRALLEKEDALYESDERFRTIFESSPVGITIADNEGRLINANPAFRKMLGYSKNELSVKFVDITHPDDREENMRLFKEMIDGRRDSYWMEKRYIRKNGSILWAHLSVTAVRDINRKYKYNFAIIEDISESKRLQDQLIHAQKMEAVGQLAGGIAHDFNNMLTAIIGYGNLLKMKLKDNEQLVHITNQILGITDRGANLVRGLLAFSRKQVPELRPAHLNTLVQSALKLLPALIGERVTVRTDLSGDGLIVMADSIQIEQVLLNLASNARDAMHKGGTISIKTERAEIDDAFINMHNYGSPGAYALLSVSDTGIGMSKATKDRIFEPFFTTKEVGKGTGLGLSMIYGIIKEHNGYILAHSELGVGSSFKIYLPLSREHVEAVRSAKDISAIGGTETILLAEDEEQVRNVTKRILEEFGFTVIDAFDGEDAVRKFMENKDRIQLLFFDIAMPNMSGFEAYDEIRKVSPGIKAIFISGYTGNIFHAKKTHEGQFNFLEKPVQPGVLIREIRKVLDS